MKILIKITKEVLRRSMVCGFDVRKSNVSKHCGIAVAVIDLLPYSAVDVHPLYELRNVHKREYFINIYKGQYSFREDFVCAIPIPDIARRFIKEFDCSTPTERLRLPEFSFEVELPQVVIDSIGIDEAHRILSESNTLELVNS